MFIYRTDWFEQKLKAQNSLYEHFDRLCEQLAQMSVEEVQSRFERIYPFLKRKEGNLRLIARIYRVDRKNILCWLTLFRRGDRAYEEFLRDRENYAHQSWSEEVEKTRLKQWLKQQKAPEKNSNSPSLPPHLRGWLHPPNWKIDPDRLLIYETSIWVQQFQTNIIRQHWEQYHQLILDLVDSYEPPGDLYSQWGVRLYGEGKHFILSAHLITQDESPREILFLICPFFQRPTDSEITYLLNHHQLNFKQQLSLDHLTNWAQRSYPSELIIAEESWLSIEDEADTNLALSAEEEAILHSVSTASPSLPLFLNGQAGSGKSTLLFHIFSDYCYRHFLLNPEAETASKPHPLFLAYNERLLEVAKAQITTLLKYHHRFNEQETIANPRRKINPFFQTFRQFLHRLLPPEDKEKFPLDQYISFHQFRQLLIQRHLQKYSPEKCWLVIRTFIKGYHLDERENYLTVEDYQEIPNKEKAVSDQEFAEIYNQVWYWYYKHTQATGLWDDQDLIRWVLHHQYYSPNYTAIFCDEAQDFTRLELQLIMRLSVFSQYDLEHAYVPSLPFAFAGDPLQTLNPTGFRWASLKATFYNEVLTVLSPTGNLNLEMNFQELVCNYRSFPAIVGVNNLIQLWRKHLFEWQEIEPQTARKIGDRAPQKFILGTNIAPDIAKTYLENALIILPCDEAGEQDYVRNDDLLNELFLGNENESQPWNMLSAIAAKGLEFEQVILYKFGDCSPNNLFQNPDYASEEIKYFLNKLYVAVSRATEQLLIVDTAKGEENLWQYATDISAIENLMQSTLENSEKWLNKINYIQWGNSPENLGKDDPRQLAETFTKEGLKQNNPDLLWRAQQAYKRLQEEAKATYCQGEALKLEGKLIAAGNCFLKQPNSEAAWDCFWQGMAWEELRKLAQDIKQNVVQVSETTQLKLEDNYPLIAYMAQEETTTEADQISQLEKLTQFILSYFKTEDSQQLEQTIQTPQWQTVLKRYNEQISKILQTESDQTTKLSWQNYAQVLETIGRKIHKTSFLKNAGECYFKIENYQQATICWETANETSQPQYYRAKAYSLGMPKGLEYLVRLGANQEIVREWEKANKPFQQEWLIYVAPVLEANGNYSLALRSYAYLNYKEKVENSFQQVTNPDPKLILFLITYYLYFQHWEEMIVMMETYLSEIIKDSNKSYFSLITRLADSKLTPEILSFQQRQRLESLFKQSVIPNPSETDFPYYHWGVVLEKIGSFGESLKYYQRYALIQNQSKLQNFARQRWLAVKKKQALYLQKQGEKDQAKNLEKEFNRRAKSWQIDPRKVNLTPPQLVKEELSSQKKQKPSLKLPPNTKVTSPSQGILQLRVRHLSIKIMEKAKQVLITDELSEQTFRVDGLTHQVMVGDMILKSQGNEGLSFISPSGSFAGRVIYPQGGCQLELRIQGINDRIQISF